MQIGSVQQGSILAAYPASLGASGLLDLTYYDPRDTNKDGVVSASEARAYALTHPQAAASQNASSSRNVSFGYHDPRDANGDGVVSPLEKADYALTHPYEATASPYTYYRPEDINRDGTVSPMEKILYALENPTAAAPGYSAQGALKATGASSSGLLDLYA